MRVYVSDADSTQHLHQCRALQERRISFLGPAGLGNAAAVIEKRHPLSEVGPTAVLLHLGATVLHHSMQQSLLHS